ncbi:hypothetical protein [Halococcus agarilyticus]|uniref:hypothetical protein n=1 Tax=Halococcus agarilyticus TaxID=1232219 RepID=UPI0006781D2E|nr:hypothetical protein [Halococcus agarilyticus]
MASARRRNTVTVGLLVAVLIAVAGLPLGSATEVGPRDTADRFRQTGAEPTPANNTTVRHENPASVDREGNVSELQSWLAGRLSQAHIDCSEGLEVGRYAACNRSDSEYPDWLDKYVNVTRESDSDTNESTAFERTGEDQSEYASDVRRFRTTVEKYRDARQNGSTTRARRLARRAQRIARRVNETGRQLTRDYRAIANGTGQNLSVAVDTTRTVTRNVTTTAESVSTEQFVNTTITATAAAQRISFRDPLRVTGRLASANGTPLADRTVLLRAGNQTRRTTTNASGGYTLTYRPTLVSLDTRAVTLRYRPTNLSVYRGDRTSVPVTIRQVQPTLRASGAPRNVSFGELLGVSGRVAVDNTSVRSVPVAVSVDGQELRLASGARARTSSNGLYRVARRLPKEVNAGQQTVRVSLPVENRALGRANTSLPVTVTSTPTALSINASQRSVNGSAVGGPVVRVAGRLTTDDGTPIRNESVRIGLNSTTSTTVSTGESGRYTATLTVPEASFAERSGNVTTTVVAAYDGASTNLDSSRARTSIRLAVPTQPTAGLLERLVGVFDDAPWAYWVVVGLGLLLLAGYGVYRYRERVGPDGDSSAAGQARTDDESERAGDAGARTPLLETAHDQLSEGDTAGAIGLAYAAVRRSLQHDLDLTTARTHWEFLDACLDRGVEGRRLDALQRLTEFYERAAFSEQSLSTETGTTALENARAVADEDERTRPDGSTAETDTDFEP